MLTEVDQVEQPWAPVVLKMYALTSDFIHEKKFLDMPCSTEHWPSKHHFHAGQDG